MAEFDPSISYGSLVFVGVVCGLTIVSLIASVVVVILLYKQKPDVERFRIWIFGIGLFLILGASSAIVGACAVYLFPVAAGVFLVLIPSTTVIWFGLYFTSTFEPNDDKVFKSNAKSCVKIPVLRPWGFWVGFALIVFLALTCVWLRDICFASSPTVVSVWLSRYNLAASQQCAPNGGQPCHVYFTCSSQPYELIVNFHHNVPGVGTPAAPQASWYYIEDGPNLNVTVVGFTYQFQEVDIGLSKRFRSVSWTYLQNLQPNRTIVVRVSLDGTVWSKSYKVRTFPVDDADLRFAVGADSGYYNQTSLFAQAGAFEPHVVLHGGDIAYENAMMSCSWRWDQWLYNYENYLVTPQGYSVPIILAIGNHEAGGFEKSDSPFFRMYFPQEPGLRTVDIRLTNHIHRLTNSTYLFVMDSDVLQHPGGAQLSWLVSWLTQLNNSFPANATNTWAIYHAPLYPSVRSLQTRESALGRQYWGPVFDQFALDIAFEAHDHSYKRSKMLRASTPTNSTLEGTRYLGDGCFGVDARPSRADVEGYFEKVVTSQYVLLGKRTPDGSFWNFTAVDSTGAVIDTFLSK